MSRGVIFDVDGVLVDSYHTHFRSWQALARETGIRLEEEQFAEGFGQRSQDVIRKQWGDRIDDQRVRELDRRKEWLYRQEIARAFPAMDGAAELIRALARDGFRVAVGSSAPPENVDLVLDRLGVRDVLAGIVTGEDVTRGKPDPEVFVIAAQRAGVLPTRCVVVEDAVQGIEAARAAGMRSVGVVSTGRSADDLRDAGADLVVRSLRELDVARLAALLDRRS